MACMVAAIDKYGDLMRMSIATPGNDFRLGGMEAPPAVISTYLGEDMTNYLTAFMNGETKVSVSRNQDPVHRSARCRNEKTLERQNAALTKVCHKIYCPHIIAFKVLSNRRLKEEVRRAPNQLSGITVRNNWIILREKVLTDGIALRHPLQEYVPKTSSISLGVDALPTLTAPAEDRNRTSPFPYGGSRFEFRAAGSSQNVSLINTVLDTIIAEEMTNLAVKVEAGASPVDCARDLLKEHMKVNIRTRPASDGSRRESVPARPASDWSVLRKHSRSPPCSGTRRVWM
eukprot:1195859-Prorocentrum_minimum.AAC.5